MKTNEIHHGDCLDLMENIPDKSIDMILGDLPFGTSACAWDSIISLEPLWNHYKRIIKDTAAIILTASQPFTTTLISSNMKMFKYSWIWEKSKAVNFFQAKNMPIRFHEDILVFSKSKIKHKTQSDRMVYNPQGLIKVDKKWSRPRKYKTDHNISRESHSLNLVIEYENYPKSIIKLGNSSNLERKHHPTQKPVLLIEYLIKTYTSPGDVVLDNVAGSGTTAIAAINTNRNWILIEKDKKYYQVATQRIKEKLQTPFLFNME